MNTKGFACLVLEYSFTKRHIENISPHSKRFLTKLPAHSKFSSRYTVASQHSKRPSRKVSPHAIRASRHLNVNNVFPLTKFPAIQNLFQDLTSEHAKRPLTKRPPSQNIPAFHTSSHETTHIKWPSNSNDIVIEIFTILLCPRSESDWVKSPWLQL